MDTKKKGILGEAMAEKWLQKRGFKIIAKNLRWKNLGEIDLLCRKSGVYYFVEVKSSFRKDESFPPEVNFTMKKFSKIVKIASLIANKENYSCWRVALLTITKNFKNVNIKFYPLAENV